MNQVHRIVSAAVAASFCLAMLGGCTEKSGTSSGSVTNSVGTVYSDKDYGFQLDMPRAGDQIAIMHTSMGDIFLRFFPEAAPKAVENFVTHAKEGYYDGLTFHRVIENFMIQSGDPSGNGTGGNSIWGGKFDDEFDAKLLNLRGALTMANSGSNTNGSQFFINQTPASQVKGKSDYEDNLETAKSYYKKQYETYKSQLKSQYADWNAYFEAQFGVDITKVPDSAWDLYSKVGGNITLDAAFRYSGGYTVFGQAYAGLDVVDAIAAVKTDDNDKPVTSVLINTIDITTYAG